jgi:hypothetical protein
MQLRVEHQQFHRLISRWKHRRTHRQSLLPNLPFMRDGRSWMSRIVSRICVSEPVFKSILSYLMNVRNLEVPNDQSGGIWPLSQNDRITVRYLKEKQLFHTQSIRGNMFIFMRSDHQTRAKSFILPKRDPVLAGERITQDDVRRPIQ